MVRDIGHLTILASAGSGKTFQLAHRYIRLLASGVRPDEVIALTFSRKAASEIFDSIVQYLCKAAISGEQAKKTGEQMGRPDFGQEEFLSLLRELLSSLHCLHVGTLDSFTVGIIRAFPMELGVSPAFQLFDNEGAKAKEVRREVLSTIFSKRHVDSAVQGEVLSAFKQATFGWEEKGLQRSLDKFIGEYQNYYQVLPNSDAWGRDGVIWPEGSPWLTEADAIECLAHDLRSLIERSGLPDNVMKRWNAFADAACRFREGSSWTRDLEYIFERLASQVEGLCTGNASVKIGRAEYDLSSEQGLLAWKIFASIMKTELRAAMERTQGIYRILDQYEQVYDVMARRSGRLTFNDAQFLLTAANYYSGGALLSRTPDQDARLYVDYRLDCRLNHWLLDEFQDTSDLQWAVFSNLADEILQDTSGQRSFFCVGDVKQAIYGWRGGNAHLFGRILQQYGSRIEQKVLSTSFRSAKPIIDTVNNVFGNLPKTLLQENAVRAWEDIWQVHQSQEGVVPERGYVNLLEPPLQDGEVRPTAEDRCRAVACLLNEINPLARGLSVAVLVRTNRSGKEMVNYLRSECRDMDVVHEGRATIRDNPVTSTLLSLVKFAAHPGDTFAWRHVQMSPLAGHLEKAGMRRNDLPLLLLREIQSMGFQCLMRNWGARLKSAHSLDNFGQKRLNDLIKAAGEFDEGGNRDCNAFLHFMDDYEVHEPASENAVRVMTIHQSKGLGFDLVILPDLQNGNMAGAGHVDFVVAHDPDTGQPSWALKMPPRIVAESDIALARQVQASDETACFDELCVLYVALTRARRALYMITSFPGKNAKAVTAATLLGLQLCGESRAVNGRHIEINGEEFISLYEVGDRDWYTGIPVRERIGESRRVSELGRDFSKRCSHRQRLVHISPSAQEGKMLRADMLFASASREGMELGLAMHELFERLLWIDDADIDKLIEDWRSTSSCTEKVKERAIEQFRHSLTSAEVGAALSHPGGNVELWHEKHFEVVMGDRWVTGAFDRAVIVRDASGRPLRATILDFKSDEIEGDTVLSTAAEKYRSQLSLYQEALSRMLQLDASHIACRLLFTRVGKVYDLK